VLRVEGDAVLDGAFHGKLTKQLCLPLILHPQLKSRYLTLASNWTRSFLANFTLAQRGS
jgi:hypothetical protein